MISNEELIEAVEKLEKDRDVLLYACKKAFDLIGLARQYFPKSIKNNAKFTLENTCATIGKAIAQTDAGSIPAQGVKLY